MLAGVSGGSRPDLAGPDLARVCAATLLIVGAKGEDVAEGTAKSSNFWTLRY